jgi:hypothetical protein
MRVITIFLSLVTLITPQIELSVPAQVPSSTQKDKVSVGNREVEVIASQILSCPAWDEIEKGYIKKVESKITKCLALVSEHDITILRKALVILFSQYPQDTSLWSRVFLLNRYLFRVPEKSPIDGNLFGGWAGVPIENGLVNRLWPFSYDGQNNLQLVGEFEGYFGNSYRGVDEFDYFQRKFGPRRK